MSILYLCYKIKEYKETILLKTKAFKAESKRLLDLMINSIYTHKEIFLRELISNASDAMDKLYYRSLTDNAVGMKREDFKIIIEADPETRTLTITDNGCGMSKEDLENNLGTIAKSGSLAFKQENEKADDVDIIGQFGVGFYSAFMVSSEVTVVSRAFGGEDAYKWDSKGVEGYTIEKAERDHAGTTIILKIKEDTDDEDYGQYLESYRLQELVKKYSDYIHFPILMDVSTRRLKEGTEDEYEEVTETRTLNSMIPIWKKNKSEVTAEDYNAFYREKFFDYEPPIHTINTKTEGQCTYDALLFIPARAPYDYYTKDYQRGLQLYSSGVLIMDKCAELLPEYFSFVKGIVDSQDLSLNISREMLQQDVQLKLMRKNIEKKIKNELLKLLKNDRENYEKFFKAFGAQIKFGVYENYGANKDQLKELLMFYSSNEKKLVTIEEYVSRMPESQKEIYYACGETVDKIDILPQTEAVKEKGYEILYLTENVDEFAIQMLMSWDEKSFKNIASGDLDLDTEEEKEELKQLNENSKDLFEFTKEALDGKVSDVRFTHRLKNHPVCLTSKGALSLEMEKVLNAMPNDNKVKAETVLEINADHSIAEKIKSLFESDRELLKKYVSILYAQSLLIEGMTVENPVELSNTICEILSK